MLSLPPFLSLSSWSAPSTKRRRRGIFSSWSPPKGKFIFPDVIRHPPKKKERKKENLFIRWKLFIPGWLHLTLVSRPKMAALILLGSLFFLDIMSYYRHISLFWPRVRDPFNEVHGDNADLFHPCVWKRGWVTDVDQPRYWNSYHLLSQSYQIRELNDFSPLSPFFLKNFSSAAARVLLDWHIVWGMGVDGCRRLVFSLFARPLSRCLSIRERLIGPRMSAGRDRSERGERSESNLFYDPICHSARCSSSSCFSLFKRYIS